MPPPHRYQYPDDEDDVPHNYHDSPPPPKPNPRILSIFLKAIIMTMITSIFFLLLGLAALMLPTFLLISLHSHHNRRRGADDSGGLSPKNLNELPGIFNYWRSGESQRGSESDCVVCLEGFKQGQSCRKLLGCGHEFHRKCVDTWLVKVAACPTCRTTIC